MMKKSLILLFIFIIPALRPAFAQKELTPAVNQLVVVANSPGAVISKDIYGHFSEHLGACIYGGIWVGRESQPAMARRMFCRYISLEGWHRPSA
jgi:alpha-N-arabinofuranosidase